MWCFNTKVHRNFQPLLPEMTKMEQQTPVQSHVLIFPFLLQGHLNPMLQLAELLCLSGLKDITFLCSQYHHRRLLSFTDAQSRFASFPGFRFETIPDGLPDDHPRSFAQIEDIFIGIRSVVEPSFRELMFSDHFKSINRPPVTCIITDAMLSYPMAVAMELGIHCLDFRVQNAAFLWSMYRFPDMVEAGDLPFTDADMDKLVTSIPGMESYLRCRDLPSFCRGPEPKDVFKMANSPFKLSGSVINTFEELEAPIVSQMRPYFPKMYTLGPLHALLDSVRSITSAAPAKTSSNNSLYEVDRMCMTWLDSQPPRSVVYVSFGSTVMMTHGQMLEFWYGLVNSGKKFLWVMRPDSFLDKDEKNVIPAELEEGTKERGYIVGWCPQEEVLVHPAVGGFLSHSGWGSVLESIVAGVPMVCWPFMGDHQINSRFVDEVWKVGLDMKDTCDRVTIEKMVNNLMADRREELAISMDNISKMAKRSVSPGGSSYNNLKTLVEDINNFV